MTIDKLIRDSWMRDFSYEDYVSICNRLWVTPVTKEAYFEQCSCLEYDMEQGFYKEVNNDD
jgi:hypothetical protein